MTGPNREVHAILSFTIEAVNDQDRAALQEQIATRIHANPSILIEVNKCENRLIVNGEDELHLTEIRKELTRQSEVTVGELRVNYKETIRRPAEAEGKYIRQIGGSGNYGHCRIRVEPNQPGEGYEFINDIQGGVIPEEYIKPIDQSVQGATELGILAGFPVVDLKVTLFGGSYHDADSNEMAFRFAASIAFKEAARKASPIVLEPVMAVEVTVPVEFIGIIIGDINTRRGRIEGIETAAASLRISAIVPLVETLTSSAQGRPKYPMNYAGYEPAPSRGFGDDATAFARNPESPKPGAGSAAADLDN